MLLSVSSSAPLRKKKESRFSSLLFFIPVVVVTLLVVVALMGDLPGGSRDGKLQVEAKAYPYDSAPVSLSVEASVNGTAMRTPSNLSLTPGHYVVVFPTLAGYSPPSSRKVPVQAGTTTFAIGTYTPIWKVISFSQTYFNSTHISAVHGVTPVFWVNVSGQVVTLQSSFFGTRPIQPGGNTSFVFQTTGTFTFWIYGDQSVQGSVTVT
jgi:hypothetical protein